MARQGSLSDHQTLPAVKCNLADANTGYPIARRHLLTTAERISTTPLDTFYTVAAFALVRAEREGRTPERFTGRGTQRWAQFANELTEADLLDLAIRDAAAAYPVPFGIRTRLPGYGTGKLSLDPAFAGQLIEEAKVATEQPTTAYLYEQAQRLALNLPREAAAELLPMPEPHQKVLDPAMGSGHFLVEATEFLALELATDPYVEIKETAEEDLTYWKRRWRIGWPSWKRC